MSEQEHLQQFKSHLNLIKSMTGDKAEQQFYNLMEKAKTTFGQLSLYMGQFYFEYAKFLLEKMEKNIDIFNAGSLPVGQQVEQDNPIAENLYEDDSSLENQSQEGAKSENNVNANAGSPNNQQQQGEKKQNGNYQPEIVQNQEQKPKAKENNASQEQKPDEEQAAQEDDFVVCAQNLLCAIKIFQTERDRLKNGGEEGKYDLNQIQKWISRCRSRLGDLYHLSENYSQAIAAYRQVVEDEQKKLGHQSNRGLAEIHYMIANSFLYDNKEGCQKIAIDEFIKSVKILLNHLNLLNPTDQTVYQVPSMEKIKVDRFAYLPKNTDTQQIKEIKEVISCLLDKIEDAYEQIGIRAQYEAEKAKNKEQQADNKFKEVSSTTPVITLGTFGNRKKMPDGQLPDEGLKKRE